MKRALSAPILLLTFLLCMAETASAYVPQVVENRVGVFGPDPDICTDDFDPLALGAPWENTTWLYDPATGVRYYVNQNPWTFFDPLGLYTGAYDTTGYTGSSPEDTTTPRALAMGAAGLVAAPVAVELGVAGIAKEGLSEVASQATNGATDFLGLKGMVKNASRLLKKGKDKFAEFFKKSDSGSTAPGGPSASENLEVTDEKIREAMEKSDLAPTQGSISKPIVEKDVKMLQEGSEAPPIQTEGGKIVDGHHREVAGQIAGKPPARTEGTLPSHKRTETKTWDDVEIDEVDYDNP